MRLSSNLLVPLTVAMKEGKLEGKLFLLCRRFLKLLKALSPLKVSPPCEFKVIVGLQCRKVSIFVFQLNKRIIVYILYNLFKKKKKNNDRKRVKFTEKLQYNFSYFAKKDFS